MAYLDPEEMITKLNYIVIGWGQYFRFGWVSRLFAKLNHYIHLRMGQWLRKKYRRHAKGGRKSGPNVGTWKWVLNRFYQPDVTGHQHWFAGKYFLIELRKACPPARLNLPIERISTSFDHDDPQTRFWSLDTYYRLIQRMESSVQATSGLVESRMR